MYDLNEKVAVVTGANRGIGAAISHALAQSGARVVLSGRSLEALEETAEQVAAASGRPDRVTMMACDVSRYDQVESTATQCRQDFGRLDIWINNAGVIDPIDRLDETDPEHWSKAVDVNVKGVYYGMRAAITIMLEQGSGTIINMSSGAATSALEGWSQYCASKAAAKKLTECGHKEFQQHGIDIIGLSPGTVATDMMATIKDSGVNPVSQLDWNSHLAPEWVGKAVAFLCTDAGKPFVGTDFSLKTEEGRKLIGLG